MPHEPLEHGVLHLLPHLGRGADQELTDRLRRRIDNIDHRRASRLGDHLASVVVGDPVASAGELLAIPLTIEKLGELFPSQALLKTEVLSQFSPGLVEALFVIPSLAVVRDDRIIKQVGNRSTRRATQLCTRRGHDRSLIGEALQDSQRC